VFDIGFAELVIIGVVALLVIGPERLPEAIRTGSAWLNRLRRGFNDIKQEVQQELHNDAVLRDLRESGEKLQEETQRLKQQFNAELGEDAFDTAARKNPPPVQEDSTTETGTATSAGEAEPAAPEARDDREDREEQTPSDTAEAQATREDERPSRD
jgi:sec-independent protein translocase protein TatB